MVERKRRDASTSELLRNSLLAGSAAGITSTLAFHPFDVIRTKMQSMALSTFELPSSKIGSSSLKLRGAQTTVRKAETVQQYFSQTIKYGGFRSLYTGLSFPLAAQAVYKANVFTVNQTARSAILEYRNLERQNSDLLTSSANDISTSDTLVCGMLAGGCNAFIFVTPVEFVRNQLIEQHSRLASEALLHERKFGVARTVGTTGRNYIKQGPFDVVRTVIHKYGIGGLWKGAGITVMRDSLGCGMFFVSFEISRHYFKTTLGEDSLIGTLLAGAAAGFGFWTVALPLDTVKTLIQTGASRSISSTLSDAMKREGILGLCRFYKGWQVALGRGAPAGAITIGTYEVAINFLNKCSLNV